MSTCPEASLFREAEIAYSLLCMSTDYDSWHSTTEAVSVEMVMGHMRHNGKNALRAVEAVLEELTKEGWEGKEEIFAGEKWSSAAGVVTGGMAEEVGSREAWEKLGWLFDGRYGDGENWEVIKG